MNINKFSIIISKSLTQFSVAILLLQASCVAQQSSSYSSSDSYSEDLTAVRPVFEPQSQETIIDQKDNADSVPTDGAAYTVNTKVDAVLDSLDKLNQLRMFVDGFTIQIYSGPNRKDALGSKAKMVKEVSDLEASIQYSQPKFRVTVGRYFSKLEAQKDLMRLRRIFSNAILLPEKIMIKE